MESYEDFFKENSKQQNKIVPGDICCWISHLQMFGHLVYRPMIWTVWHPYKMCIAGTGLITMRYRLLAKTEQNTAQN